MQTTKIGIFFAILLSLISASVYAEGQVSRAQFTTAISNREPVDRLSGVVAMQPQLFYFTELSGLAGQTVTHRWEHAGTVAAEVSFNVGGDRWRVWSSKNIIPEAAGEWRVSVVDAKGQLLDTSTIEIK